MTIELIAAREPDEASAARAALAASLPQGSHIHISGICGSGTSAVLSLLKQLGYRVTGSDKAFYPPMGEYVRSLADKVYEGYAAGNLDERPALVVIGNALSRGNPELEAVLEQHLPFASMPEVFAGLLIGKRDFCPHSIVFAGTHGKTTTSAAAAVMLETAGRRPGYFIGGLPLDLPGNIRAVDANLPAEQRVVVLEGDEYDSAFFAKYAKFQCYRPDIAVVTSLEFDHADIYSSIDEIEEEFTRFVRRVPATGFILACDRGERLQQAVARWRSDSAVSGRILQYGLSADCAFRLCGRKTRPAGAGQKLELVLMGRRMEAAARLNGEHNALNLLAAAGAVLLAGVEPAGIAAGIEAFRGVRRRQQLLLDEKGIKVLEDFAHHPTAVAATLIAIREAHPGQRLIAVFEPRSNTSRRGFFQEDYGASFESADLAVLLKVNYAGGYEGRAAGVGALDVAAIVRGIQSKGTNASCFDTVGEIEEFLIREARPGDVILLMSNGDFGGLPSALPAALRKRNEQRGV